MKQLTQTLSLKVLAGFLMFSLISLTAFAQDSTSNSSTTTTTSSVTTEQIWYMQPWVWVVGGIVLLILLISLFRGKSGSRDTVTYTKTVKRDEDI